MQVKVKLFASLRQGREKECMIETQEGATVTDIIRALQIKKEEIAILLVNGINGSYNQQLSENDLLALFPPMGGG
ncbi:MAG: MoaD/ThiS family protein [Dehalobacterium sp.]